jgi:starch phosphorylase
MGFFAGVPLSEVRRITGMDGDIFNMTLAGLRLARLANGVSRIHGEVARRMWEPFGRTCPIIHITNAQNHAFWHDASLTEAMRAGDALAYDMRKKELKKTLFQIVADQTGKLFDPEVLTLVWARRYADYKRADLITRDMARFQALVSNTDRPIQIIWAGKPYPNDPQAIGTFNGLVHLSKQFPNVAVLTGYEISLSKALKQGSDVWLNNPRLPREASGTSGMTAAMNGSVNLSTQDGWIPEFARHGHNAFVVEKANPAWPIDDQDEFDRKNILEVLETEILPLYYDNPSQWRQIAWNSMKEIVPFFDSDRMAAEYYQKLYVNAAVHELERVG